MNVEVVERFEVLCNHANGMEKRSKNEIRRKNVE